MIERYSWDTLPDAVRLAVRQHLGPTTVIRDVEQGQNCNLALVLRTDDAGDVFLKGVRGISPRMRWLRNEAEAGGLAPGVAPATLFSADVKTDEQWFIVGFEYVHGRPADLSPDSDDLGIVSATLKQLGAFPGGPVQPLGKRWASADWWEKLAAEDAGRAAGWNVGKLTEWCRSVPGHVEGSSLLHTDLHEHQFMIDDAGSSVRVIDWGRPASGAAWVDTAFLVVRLIAAGNAPAIAETWATTVPAWSARTEEGITAFACYVAGLWSYRAATTPFPGAQKLSTAARAYAQYRLRQVSSPV